MISINYYRIPNYLKDSSFYNSLFDEEDEGQFQIPERCFVENDIVNSEKDFQKLLRVTAFWSIARIPLSIIQFCSRNAGHWVELIDKEQSELTFVQDLLYVFAAPCIEAKASNLKNNAMEGNADSSASLLVRAVERGRIEIVEHLASTPEIGGQAIATAAKTGRLDILKLFHKHGHHWDIYACTLAVQGGHLDCLQYLHENGCPWHIPSLHIAAAKYNQLECLQYLFEQGVPWSSACNGIAARGNLEMLKYAADNGCVFDKSATNYAAEFGHVECLRYLLHDAKVPLGAYALNDACSNGHLPCVQLLHEYGAEWTYHACTKAAAGGHLLCLQYLHEKGCPWDESTSAVAAKLANYAILHYVISNGCPYDPWILDYASYRATEDGVKCYKYLVEVVQVPALPNSNHFNEAFARGNYFIVQYLLERDPVAYRNHKISWPIQCQWQLQKLQLDNRINLFTVLDTNVLRCIKCAFENNWDIAMCGSELIQFIADKRSVLPLCFEVIKPWLK